jgi:hypothetical protein
MSANSFFWLALSSVGLLLHAKSAHTTIPENATFKIFNFYTPTVDEYPETSA